jgi:SH3-like domain-containing protein
MGESVAALYFPTLPSRLLFLPFAVIIYRALKTSVLSIVLTLLAGCGSNAGESKEYAYVAAPQLTLRDRVAAVYNKVGTAKNGERVEVLERSRRFVRVRTERGEEGWVEQRNLASEEVYKAFQQLAKSHASDPAQAPALTRFNVNLHSTPLRDGEKLYQLNEGEKIELLERAATPKPVAQAAPKPGARTEPPAVEDWWLVRAAGGRVGWLLSRMVDVDIPLEVGQYAEDQRIVAYFVLNHVEDDGRKVPQYLVVLTDPKDGMPFDYNQIRVFTWNTKRDRYETAYRERRLNGQLPVRVGTQSFVDEGTLPVFTLRLKDASGAISERTFKLNGVMVRRVLAPGEKQPAEARRAPRRKQGRR